MSSRRYPTAERYEERERDFYGNSNRSTREYDELDVDITRTSGREPNFLRGDYGRTTAGPLVVRETRPARARSVEREELIVRRGDRDSYRRDAEREEIDVTVRKEQERAPRTRRRELEREEISVRRSDPDLVRTREIERDEDIYIRRGPRRREREVEKEEIVIRRDDRSSRATEIIDDRESVHVRARSRSRHRRPVEEDREEVIISRRDRRDRSSSSSRSPRRRGRLEKEEIIIRRTEERSPSPPPPPSVPEPVIRPPIHQEIHQEIITHHRHIDHGVERARSPRPPPRQPSPPPRKVEETLEVDIRRRGTRGTEIEEDIIINRDSRRRRDREELSLSRARSVSAGPRRRYYDDDDDLEEEAEYYNRKAMERAYVGEGYNGATRDWAIVDVPPGTERVRMDGAGGSTQVITWQRYNGVRRSKFITGDSVYDSGFGVSDRAPSSLLPLPRTRPSDMWTEITKDLVVKDAIDYMGYEYEETEFFFYVMDYLKYEDVLQLVEISDDIRRERRRRIREIEWEREEMRNRRAYDDDDDDYYEREVIINMARRR